MPPPVQKGPARPGAAPEEAARDQRHQTDQLADDAGKLEEELEALKAKYEQYFLGIERREPVRWREEMKKKVLRLKSAFTRNTGLRFRLQSLHARFVSYERLWLRGAREKEEGTYRRDVFKARLRGTDEEPAPPPSAPAAPRSVPATAAAPATARPPSGLAAPTAKAAPVAPHPAARPASGAPAAPAPNVKTAAAAAPRPAAPGAARPPAGGADPRIRALYDEYVAAKRRCNEDVSRITYDAVARSVQKQVPELIARYKAKSVDFRVDVKDGKAVLKAIPKV